MAWARHYVVWAELFVVADNDLLYHVALIAVGADITSYVDQSDVVVIIEIKDKFGGGVGEHELYATAGEKVAALLELNLMLTIESVLGVAGEA